MYEGDAFGFGQIGVLRRRVQNVRNIGSECYLEDSCMKWKTAALRSRTQRVSQDTPSQPAGSTLSELTADRTPVGLLDEYMTTEQLARELDLAPLTLIRWRQLKKGPPVTWIGRRLFYRRSSVRAWMSAQEQAWTD